MTDHQKTTLLQALARRCASRADDGRDPFVSTQTLSFDVGLNTRTIRHELDAAVARGHAERKYCGPGKPYCYRIIAGGHNAA